MKITERSLLKSLVLFKLSLILLPAFAQQDPLFTQFWNIPTAYNPANSGLFYKHQAGINYRDHWVGVNGAPMTLMLTYNTKLAKYKSGIGFNYEYETVGAYKKHQFALNYSYHLDLGNEKTLAFGASAALTQLNFTPGYFTEFTPGDGLAFLANFGIAYKTKRLTLGLSSTQINEPRIEEAYFKFSRHYYFTAAYDIKLSDHFMLKPQLLFRTDAVFLSTDINLLAYYKKQYWLGITCRNLDEFCFLAGVDWKEKFRVGYSYDLPLSKLSSISSGSHEIVLGFMLK